jgi:hypothetical protein
MDRVACTEPQCLYMVHFTLPLPLEDIVFCEEHKTDLQTINTCLFLHFFLSYVMKIWVIIKF